MKKCHHLLVLEGALFRRKLGLLLEFLLLCFGGAYSHYFFPFGLETLGSVSSFVVDPSFVLRHRGLKLLSRFLSYLSLFNKHFPDMSFDSSHMNFHLIEEVLHVCLEQHRQGHACRAHKREVMKPFYVISYELSSFLDCLEEFVHSHISIILLESRKKLGF